MPEAGGQGLVKQKKMLSSREDGEEGECRLLEFWLEKEQTLETYSALLQKS